MSKLSRAYLENIKLACCRLLKQAAFFALWRALFNAGSSIAAGIAKIAITMRSSIGGNVLECFFGFPMFTFSLSR